MQNTHEVAQSIAPESRIVYVDNDPMVLAHARALLVNTTPEGVTGYVDADYHDPELIISDARNILNFSQPIAVMFMGSLGHAAKFDTARSIINRVLDAVLPGSYLALYEGTDTTEAAREAEQQYQETGAVAYHLRSVEQVRQCFTGLELVDPGVVSITQWRPNLSIVGTPVEPIGAYGGVARKP
jgi:hypothetical protein